MPSGLSAIATALIAYLKTGDHVLMSDSVYGPARTFALGVLARMGIETTFYDPAAGAGIAALMRPNTRVVVTGISSSESRTRKGKRGASGMP